MITGVASANAGARRPGRQRRLGAALGAALVLAGAIALAGGRALRHHGHWCHRSTAPTGAGRKAPAPASLSGNSRSAPAPLPWPRTGTGPEKQMEQMEQMEQMDEHGSAPVAHSVTARRLRTRLAAGAIAGLLVVVAARIDGDPGRTGATGAVVAPAGPRAGPAADPCVRPELAPALAATVAAPAGASPAGSGEHEAYGGPSPAFRAFQECRQRRERPGPPDPPAGHGQPDAGMGGDLFLRWYER